MKRRILVLLLVLILLLMGFAGYKRPLKGHISSFRYSWGHYWYGFFVESIVTEDDAVYAVRAYEKTGGMADPTLEDWEVRVVLTDDEIAAFDKLILQTLRLPDWDDYFEPPDPITDQDSWVISYVWDGAKCQTGGYAVFPHRLKQINEFFSSLDWPQP